ncbi:MAG: SpvB/TcaC N-terminal domain-containing protein, partial [Paludibacteraceae bacterium]|nr:SpvB/TcaC N-terminal domain-containing protein [Paludibacteraceae bacterium]
MKAKNIAILLFSAVIGCAVAKTYSSLQEEGGKTTDVRKERKTNVKKDVVSESEPTVEHETESVQAEVAKPSYGEYASLQKSGVVGLYGGNSIDNPEDNIFEVVIPSSFSSSDKVVLSYDVEGVAGSTGVALSINDRTAMGGMVAYSSDKRSSVNEEIDAAWLVKGKNRIMFTLPDSANYGYRVSNLKIAISANTASGNIVATASKLDGEVYVRGFVKNAKAKSVNIAGKEYELTHGSFEALISGDDEDVRITCGDASKTFHATTVSGCIASTRLICVNKSEKQTQKEFSLAKKENNKVQDVAATLNVDSGVVKKDMKITMTNLRHKDLPALDLGMTNVTDGVEGYRFLPHGAHFDGEGAVVSLKYDRTKIPSGYTENDIRTYYFDLDTKHWVALKRDSIDKENNLIVSRTNHFTDMINGVIQAPESPETQGFTPTMMSDLKLADPTAKIQSIAPPTANNRGSANLSYSFEMPPARHGMQPSLGIQYNSDGGTGLLGEGWDLSVPTISVETRWGVPRYDDILETETYLMDGSMLVLDNGGVNYLAHRALNQIKRSEVKRTDGAVTFHPRKEGSFSKIERLGNSPAEYTWVVTDKSGTKYYYGKKNADGSMKGVLMGKNHEGKDVIAEWKLVRIQEVHGDWVEYEYETVQEEVLGGTTNALYLKEVRAGNSNSKEHTRVVLSNDKVKKIKRGNARYGFLTSNIHMLKDVTVYYEDAMLRKYSFGYKKDTPFSADLLETVSHYDASGKLVASNTMTYHEMEGTSLYNVDVDDKFSSKETIEGVFPKILKDGFDDHLTMINGGQSEHGFSVGGGCNVGVLTVFGGLSYSYGNNDSEGKISLTDINGDGIPDKVFANSKGIFYEEGVYVKKEDKSGDVHEFKPAQPCGGTLKLFSKSSSSSHTLGEDVGVGIGPASISATFSQTWETSKVPVFFNDFNSDGLIDIAHNGKVYFNHLDSDGKPTFSEYSSYTENPLSNMKPDMIPDFDGFSTKVDRAAVEKSLKEKFPLHDVVRVWKAPFDGQIEITGDIKVSSSDDKNADGIEYAIQIENNADKMKYLAKGGSAKIEKTAKVQKGDRVFFRVGSKEQGVNDEVTWSPVIRYINNPVALDVDENGLSLTEYSAKNDYLEGFISTATVEGPATVTIKGDYDFQGALVPVNLVYEAKTKSKEDVKNSEIGAADGWTSIDTDVITLDNNSASSGSKEYREINVSENDVLVLSFDIKSDAQIDPHKIVWSPLVTVYKEGAIEEEKVKIYPKKQMYNNVVCVHGSTVINAKTLESDPSSSESIEYADDNVYLECETAESFDDKDLSIFIMDSEGVMEKLEAGASKVYKVDEIHDKAVRIMVYSDSLENASAQYKVAVKREVVETYEDEMGVTQTKNYFITENEGIPATIYCQFDPENQRLGSLYRGWGAFAYMGTVDESGNKTAINLSDLHLDTERYEGYNEDEMKDWKDDDNLNEKIKGLVGNESANETKFFSMCYSVADNRYVGATILAYLDGEKQCPSRMGNPVIDVDSEIPSYDFSSQTSDEEYGVAASPTLLSTSFTHSATLGGGVKAGKFGVGASGSHSETTTKTETSVMDMNGDGYPDWLSGNDEKINIKFTVPDGTLKGISLSVDDWGLPVQEAEAKAVGLNASFSPIKKEGGDGDGEANTNIFSKAAWSVDNLKKIASQKKTTECSVSASGNMSDGESHSINEWYDINGDGLPDMVYDNGKVRVNLGYSFSEAVNMDGLDNICKGESSTWGAGLGVAVTLQGKANISVGTNATFTETYGTHQYMDVNGDGLPDKVFYDDPGTPGVPGNYYANINTGTGFDSNKWYLSGSPINKSKSTAASVYANGGATIPAGWIVTVTPFVSGATTDAVSKTQKAMSDFDGDGFPDLLESDSETSLSVRYSKVGATNKLKSVTTPFGGRYELEYIHSTPTQQHPGGKWVMSKLTVTDTQRDINDCPPVVSVFDYSGGKRDRRERDFYGFAEVRTKRMNVNDEGKSVVESQIVQNYDTTNYYTSGTTIGSYVCDADQQQFFSKETSKLNMYDVSGKGNVTNGREVSATTSFDENGRYFVAPFESTTKRFEEDLETTTNIVENKYGNFGNLTEYKYTDGITNASYTTTIQYKDYDEETGVFGLPTEVKVESDGNPMRHVSAEYDGSGYNPTSMTKMTQYLDKNTTATIEFKYDTLGNIIEKIMPKVNDESNLMKKRMTYTYEYDKKYRMYPTRVTDGFGYRSDMFNYDYRYGIPLSVKDMNGFMTEYEIDDLGRVTKVTAPNELSSGAPYTILYHYGDVDSLRYARTYHYDPQHPKEAMV